MFICHKPKSEKERYIVLKYWKHIYLHGFALNKTLKIPVGFFFFFAMIFIKYVYNFNKCENPF